MGEREPPVPVSGVLSDLVSPPGPQSKAAEEIKTKQKKEVQTLKELDLSQ